MKLHFIRSQKPRNAVLEELYRVLDERGFEVTEGIPEATVHDLDCTPQHDLYILKSRTALALCVAGVLHQRRARMLNPYPSCLTLMNKIVVAAAMRDAGIPTPRSWAVSEGSRVRGCDIGSVERLIVKPFDGIHSQGITVVNSANELSDLPVSDGPLLIQEFVEGCRERFKIHCVGERVFATRKPFSLGGTHRPGEPCALSEEMREIALRCGKLFGVGLYGLDILVGDDGPVVVDVNSFPKYDGVPQIAQVIADYIDSYACAHLELPSPLPSSSIADCLSEIDA